MARTLLDLDLELLDNAQKILGTKTKKATVAEALREIIVREARQQEIKSLLAGAGSEMADKDFRRSAWQ